jgi:tetratricopeptide (TPR) repeat protein
VLRSLRARFRLARAIRNEDYPKALIEAEKVLMRNPWDVRAHLRMAEVFAEVHASDLAVWTLEQIRPLHAKNARVNRPLARLYERRGNYTQAIALWELVRKAEPTDIEAQRKAKDLAASATIAKGKYEQAVKGDAPTPLVTDDTGSAVVETKPEHKSAPETDLAMPVLETRVPREVTSLLTRIQNHPANASAYLQLAAYYRRNDQLEQAAAILNQGLAATSNDFEIGLELLDLEIEPFRRDLAVADEKLRKKPTDESLQQIRTRLVKEINTRELDYYRRRADRFPAEVAARFEMSVRLLRANQTDEAIRLLQTVRNDPRHHGKALFYLGFCFKSRNNWRLAQRNFEEAMTYLGNDDQGLRKDALYQLAVGCADAGDLQKAVDFACELANVDYGYKDISQLLDTWQTKVAK